MTQTNGPVEVVVVGGGAAGLAAALVLGRARRRVVLVDNGGQSNLAARGVGGLLGHDGRPPAELYSMGAAELDRYPTVTRRAGEVGGLERQAAGTWRAVLDDGMELEAAHVVLAMGMRYAYPDLPGVAERWGGSVFHCPFCHGWEHRDGTLVVLAGGPGVVERTLLLSGWTDDVTVVAAPGALSEDDRGLLAGHGVGVVDGPVTGLRGQAPALTGLDLADGRTIPATGMLIPAPHTQRSALAVTAGARCDDSGHVIVDEIGRTGVDGLWAAGDLTSPMAILARVAAAGSQCGSWIVHALTAERFGLPFPPPHIAQPAPTN